MYNLEKLISIIDRFLKEAKACYRNKHYLAALILYGATLETLLLAMYFVYPNKVRKTNTYKQVKRRSRRKREIFLEFTLNNLIEINTELKWIPMYEKVNNIGKVEEWIQYTRNMRNLIHPANILKSNPYSINLYEVIINTKGSKIKIKSLARISKETVEGILHILPQTLYKDIKIKTSFSPAKHIP